MGTASNTSYAELSSPTSDWELCWRLSRLSGLGSDLLSFNFKLLHGLLVTKQRMHQFTPGISATCSHCDDDLEEDIQHALLHCGYNDGAGQALLSAVHVHMPDVSAAALLRLELPSLSEELQLPMVTFLSSVLLIIWEKCLSRSRILLYDTRATLEARCLLLRKPRVENMAPNLAEILNNL